MHCIPEYWWIKKLHVKLSGLRGLGVLPHKLMVSKLIKIYRLLWNPKVH